MLHKTSCWVILWMLFIFHASSLQAQVKSFGTPLVRNYDVSLIPAGIQTWMIDYSENGMMYFANNDGLLEFDGVNWRLFALPNETVVRSVKANVNGKIFVGGYNEFGYFEPDGKGKLVYVALEHQLAANERDFGEIWKIFLMNDKVVFQGFTQFIIFEKDNLIVVPAPEMFHFSFKIKEKIFVNDLENGLLEFTSQNKLQKINGVEKLKGKLIWAMLPLNDNVLIATSDEGVFLYNGTDLKEWQNQTTDMLKQMQIYCAIPINDEAIAFGTIQNGLVICDTSGRLLQNVNINNGLQNNTVLSLQKDPFDNLWLGLDNGIDYVEINSPLTYISSYDNISSGYAAVIHEGNLYLGTNRGVFYRPWKTIQNDSIDQKFKLVRGTQGQVWTLKVIDNTLFCGHNSGVFVIDDGQSEMISNIQGGWNFIQPQGRNDLVLGGTYTYLVKFVKRDGQWQAGTSVKGYKESSSDLFASEDGGLWVSHGYKGVYKLDFDQNYDSVVKVSFYDDRNGLPSNRDNRVTNLFGKPVFITKDGLYLFDNTTKRFFRDENLTTKLYRNGVNQLKEDAYGNVWYFTSNEMGVFRLLEDGNYSEVEIPFRKLNGKFIKWYQFLYPMDEKNVIIGLQSGFAHYTPNYSKNYQLPFKSSIRNLQIIAGKDSVLYSGAATNADLIISLPYKYNQLRFDFAANDFENPEGVRYQIMLEGFDPTWIDWQQQTSRQFTNLRHGLYTFKVKSTNLFGTEGSIASLKLKILPPWYLTYYAYIAYVLMILFVVIAFYHYIKKRMEISKQAFEDEQRKLFREKEKQMQIDALKNEAELIRLRVENLQAEKLQKDKELANTTMQIIQKSKSLAAIKKDLNKLAKDFKSDDAAGNVKIIIKKINRTIESEKQWEVFESHFENVHEEFLKRLKEAHPELTPRELKLCAYLRLNISSKEIANLMNISVRGVEISRYRLRKKLGLEHDTNLTDFILTF